MGRRRTNPDKRYTAAVSCGAIYVVIGLFGAAVTGVLTAFPRELVVAVAGLALLSSIAGGLAVAVKGRNAPRGGAHHLPRHALGRDACRHRLGLLGRGGGGAGARGAALAAPEQPPAA